MIIPHEPKLQGQIFTENKVEFVWLFDDQQFILGINKDKSVYIEAGDVNSDGDYIEGSHWVELSPNGSFLTDEKLWNDPKYNFCNYNFFTDGKELVPLVEEITEFLN